MTRYDIDRRKAFLNILESDAANMVAMKEMARAHLDEVVGVFYDHLLTHGETKAHLTSDRHIARLRKTQSEYFLEMMEGVYDEAYMHKRLVIGRTHERIGLEPQWYMGAYSLYLNTVMNFVFQQFAGDPEQIRNKLQSLVKIIFLDMGFAIDTYIEAMMDHEQELKTTFVTALREFGEGLGGAVNSLVATSAELSASAAQQSATLTEVTATIAEVKGTSQQALQTSNSVIQTSEQAREASDNGTSAVEDATRAMQAIQAQVEAIAGRILDLSEQTQQIGEIIKSVNEISEQSKLLALNAAIEAARAGEHGRGFAVVASEIRSLADQSREATRQVGKILGEIQKATNGAVMATEEGSKKVDSGVELARRAGDNIHALTDAIRKAADAGRLISSVVQQQNVGVSQVADAMVGLDSAVRQTAAGLKESEGASLTLAAMSEQMSALVERFSVTKERQVVYKLT